jgi:hypothetical protein
MLTLQALAGQFEVLRPSGRQETQVLKRTYPGSRAGVIHSFRSSQVSSKNHFNIAPVHASA